MSWSRRCLATVRPSPATYEFCLALRPCSEHDEMPDDTNQED